MSRTYKDRPNKIKYEDWDKDRVRIPYIREFFSKYSEEYISFTSYFSLETKTTKPKKRKEVDTEIHWMSAPSWWNNLYHTRRHRRNFRTFLNSVVKCKVEDTEEMLEPFDSNKPHVYYD